jgi:hypothetical protein
MYDTTYSWRVRARNAFGSSAFSPPWRFTVFTPETTTVSVEPNWNVVSVPLTVLDGRRATLFPSATSDAFAFNPIGGYAERDTMQPGTGYWLKFPAGGATPVSGGSRPSDTLHLESGWNLIGSISVPVDVSTIVQIPDSVVHSLYYGYHGGYAPADTIAPGGAYWVKSAAAGKLFFQGAGLRAIRPPSAQRILGGFGALSIEDAAGHRQLLYAAAGPAGAADVGWFELPPVPPPGIFDARFASGRMAEIFAPEGDAAIPVKVASAAYPLVIRWAGGRDRLDAVLTMNGHPLPLQDGAAIRVEDSGAALAMRVSAPGGLPGACVLERNYPNPFNPETRIRYGLPVSERVSLKVYNLLGQEIAVLAEGFTDAGYHSTTWDGRTRRGENAGSGVYFVRLETASGFIATQKVMLIR